MSQIHRILGIALAAVVGCHAGSTAGPGVENARDRDGVTVEVAESEIAPVEDRDVASAGDESDAPLDGDYLFVPDLGLYLCPSYDDCPDGKVCCHHVCQECCTHGDCASWYCRPDKTCVPVTCDSPEDCVPYFCEDGKCVECRTWEDCWPNHFCDESHRCRPGEPCATTPDCPEGFECYGDECVQWECKESGVFQDTCPEDQYCDLGTHKCVPDLCPYGFGICLSEKEALVCRPNGGGFMESHCPEGWKCKDGHCKKIEYPPPTCNPTCDGKACGVDGCGALCGVCEQGQACVNGQCVPVNPACIPRNEPGCPDCPCEGLVCKTYPDCCTKQWDNFCARDCDERDPSFSCPDCATLFPAGCAVRECGVEPCGTFCGACMTGGFCVNGTCQPGVPPDMGRACGSDAECASGLCAPVGRNGEMVCTAGCSESVGCPSGWTCEDGRCRVKSDCLGKCKATQCGVDECGTPCGNCPPDQVCDQEGRCVSPGDGCDPTPGIPTCGGCACQTCVCSYLPSCCNQEWSFACALACQWPECDSLGLMAATCAKPGNPCAGLECGTLWFEETGVLYDCGSCSAGWKCQGHRCVCQPNCEGRVCGPDGCGGYCGAEQESSLPPQPPFPNVFCEDGVWKFVPAACYVGGGPHCLPGPPGWECMDFDCICDALPLCCGWGFWEQACVDYAITFCGLQCDPQPWSPG